DLEGLARQRLREQCVQAAREQRRAPAGRHDHRHARAAGGRHRRFSSRYGPITSASSGVLWKASTAWRGVHTTGSPRTLNEVLTSTGTPVRSPNARSSAWYLGLLARLTVCTRAVPSVWQADGMRWARPGSTS